MPRLFVAVDLDEHTCRAVAAITDRVAHRFRGDPRVRRVTWVRTEHLHLTLRFLGDVDEQNVSRVRSALGTPLTSAAFDVSFEGLGMFPAAGLPHVLWLGVREGEPELQVVHREVQDRLGSAGISRDREPLRPHLTLGRFRNPRGRPDLQAIDAGNTRAGPSRIDHVTVYESRLSAGGPTHTVLARAKLNS